MALAQALFIEDKKYLLTLLHCTKSPVYFVYYQTHEQLVAMGVPVHVVSLPLKWVNSRKKNLPPFSLISTVLYGYVNLD